MDYKKILEENKLIICEDNIIRDEKNHPRCPNNILQYILEKKQDKEKITYEEDNLYGQCILSLVEICINNKMLRYQTTEIKDECRSQMYYEILQALPKYFDRTKGSTAYSYGFRIGYTAACHVLTKVNKERDFNNYTKHLIDYYMALENSSRKINTHNIEDI